MKVRRDWFYGSSMAVNLESGRYFFHYTTRDAAFGGILPGNDLRLSRYGVMRDPLENQRWRFTFAGYGPRDDARLATDLAEYDEFEQAANDSMRDRSFLLSLTIDTAPAPRKEQEPFCRGWARARMWEQYAENHRGVCLVFDREKLTRCFIEAAERIGAIAQYHQAVIYDGGGMHKPIIDRGELREPEFFSRYVEDNSGSLFFTKTRDWETEHEYRFVSIAADDASPLVLSYGDSLEAVIAGDQLPAWEYPAVEAACERAGARALKMKWKNWRPGLIPLPEERV